MNKKQIIKTLEQIAIYMEIKGENPFKTSAYRKAAQALETDERPITEIEDPSKLKGIGKGTAEVIEELRELGKSTVLEELQAELPAGLLPLLKLPGLGGKKIGKLYQELGVTDMDSLNQACLENKVQSLSGFGKKTEEKIVAAIAEVGQRPDRLPLAFVLPIADEIEEQLKQIPEIKRFSRAGSLRRMRETVKDLDFIISTDDPSAVRERLVQLDKMSSIIASGDTKVSVELAYDYTISVDFRLVEDKAYATTLHHFTGSKDHNVKMRQLAKERGEKISEYGVEVVETGEVQTFASEAEFFNHFGLHEIPPEAREDQGEVEQFADEVPLIHLDDINGDLHMHSTWSDGAYSIEEMAEAARAKGYSFIAITDHSKFLKVANGLTEERLRKQRAEIERLNENYDDFKILAGVEMDILPDGTLDYDDVMMAEMDFVIASIHSAFSQDRQTIMDRLTTALNNQNVDLIAHPTGRLIGRREGYDVDLELLIELAAKTDTALELNANPNRLDLAAKWLRKAEDQGVKLAINTDAHDISMLDHMEIGVSTAKKGMVKKKSVLNTWSLDELEQFLTRHH
ncbi:DNA polymerase/3'-5' exonuclease PolX [Desertibacillus haloalkaliphilus]|uniref:DNA polymerase/3'-5' exonuclease PolX n=1 Tax=Desertibacillus haloalkaliphilus TaxID=1328930 RepID=UPI001C27D1C1|nr:DNA polymerase/3'-5' exonuclease PolX [Desertibacillus haloalkaliphilus]MBU8905114.1 DNA polymerase/3'-5' exonuclease PolX [Desertibacillus haloalkaliphilus]